MKRSTRMMLAASVAAGGWKLVQRFTEADLHGEVVVITGGSRGLGLLMAREFVREGCRIVICARNEGELERARADLESRGAEVLAVPCDVGNRIQVDHLVQQSLDRFGSLDILVNNAGIIQVGPWDEMTSEDFRRSLDVMFWGILNPVLAALPHMKDRGGGRIVNITSIGGMVSVPHLLPYSCAKYAAVGLSQGLRAELGRDGITVTTIVPGLMRLGSHLNARFHGRRDREFIWFSLGASLPFLSLNGERAARQIVQATKRGMAVRILGLPANILERFHGLFPGTTANLMGLANRILPRPAEAALPPIPGKEVERELHSPFLDRMTALGRTAARRTFEADST